MMAVQYFLEGGDTGTTNKVFFGTIIFSITVLFLWYRLLTCHIVIKAPVNISSILSS